MGKKLVIILVIFAIICCVGLLLLLRKNTETYLDQSVLYRTHFKNSLLSPTLGIKTEEIHHPDKTTEINVKNMNNDIILVLKPNNNFLNKDYIRKTKGVLGPEDIRIISNGKTVYVFFCDDYISENKLCYSLYMKKIFPTIEKSIPLIKNCHEKNWVPFFNNDGLFVVYSFSPRMIVYSVNEKGKLDMFQNSPSTLSVKNVRGGTNGIPYNEDILTVGHIQRRGKNYYHVFIVFEKEYPFSVKRYSKPIKFQKGKIQFATHLEKYKDFFVLSYGVDDHKSVTVKITANTIEKLLTEPKKDIIIWKNEVQNLPNPINETIKLQWEDSVFTQKNFPGLYYDKKEKQEIFKFAKSLPRGQGVIDVGAHIGDLALPLAQALVQAGRADVTVYAIDPSKEKCDFLKAMTTLNKIPNIKIINAGLARTDLNFAIKQSNGNNTGSYTWEKSDQNKQTRFLPLDQLYKENLIGPIGLYHIDVEGMEENVLHGSEHIIREYKPIICVEKWVNKDSKKCKMPKQCPEIFAIMSNYGYRLFDFLPNDDMVFVSTATPVAPSPYPTL